MVRNLPLSRFISTRRLRIYLIDDFRVFRIVMIWISVVDLVVLLVEDLELHEVQALLDQVDVPEVLQMEDKLCDRS